ncbi:MAG: hypothetical protein ACP5H2_12825, partial [Solirubrobacteraceae bacterium]
GMSRPEGIPVRKDGEEVKLLTSLLHGSHCPALSRTAARTRLLVVLAAPDPLRPPFNNSGKEISRGGIFPSPSVTSVLRAAS